MPNCATIASISFSQNSWIDRHSFSWVCIIDIQEYLPSLEFLQIRYCPNLKGWWKRRRDSNEVDDDDDNNHGGISTIAILKAKNSPPSFTRLSSLSIYHCPKLYSMPIFPYLEELYLGNSNLSPLEQTISMRMISMASSENPTTTTKTIAESIFSARSSSSSSSSSSTLTASFAPLSKLKSLRISLMEGNDGLLLQTIKHLTALEELVLFNYNGDGMELEWQCLRKLQNLRLYDHPKLASLPVGLQQATSLWNFKILNCSSLKTLPKWICNIISSITWDLGLPQFDIIAWRYVFEDTNNLDLSHLSGKLQEWWLACPHPKLGWRSSLTKRRRFKYWISLCEKKKKKSSSAPTLNL